ncbi:MAG: DUF2089 domain-containing protein [Tessaracoccus sp.]|uniref:DUF2089 domain-containing protein n=1 Tax=Tessaracoccus sp. TaxID=1971211 RepID=UPI001ECC0669|nr:DUF2089 domain-containing protein [Tessaracoccus sp.]MBK7819693.1 DUF2089 domain-containing protein [Tessaracoccus sp.]
MGTHLYHAPAECPVCGDTLITTRKGCRGCGTEIAGEFASCEFCALSRGDLELLRVFLGSRGNLREVEKHLQVSYPTARARLDAVLAKIGLEPGAEPQERPDPEPAHATSADTAEEQILARVARGELSAEAAARLLS